MEDCRVRAVSKRRVEAAANVLGSPERGPRSTEVEGGRAGGREGGDGGRRGLERRAEGSQQRQRVARKPPPLLLGRR